jgi:hypothetical protein
MPARTLRSRLTIALAAVAAIIGCTELNVPPTGATADLRVTPDTIVLRTGDSSRVVGAPVDAHSTLLAQKVVTWSTSAASVATISAAGEVHAVGAGTATLTGTVDGITAHATVVVTGKPATIAVFAGNGQSAAVNSAVATAPAVRVVDASGNPVPRASVSFAVTAGAGAVVAGSGLTGFDGVAAVTSWTLGPFKGANTLTATAADSGVAGNPVLFTATGTVGAPSAATSTVTANPSAIPPSNGAARSTITITVKDAAGSTISGATVTIASSGTGNIIDQPTDTTNGLGQTTAGISSNVAETKTITATVNGSVVITQTATVTISNATASGLRVSTHTAGAVSNHAFTTQPVVKVADGFGNTVPTATNPITATVTSGDGTLIGTATVNASAGLATFSGLLIRGTSATSDTLGTGTHIITFSSPGFASVADTFNVGISFSYNVVNVLTRNCNGCHGFTYANLTASPTTSPFSCAGNTRVVASDTTNSFAYQKIKSASPSCGGVMPTTGQMSINQIRLIRDWIVQGAPNN